MEDISNVIKELSDIFSSNDIPDNLKDAFNNIKNNSNETNVNSSNTANNSNNCDNTSNNNNFNFDINMIIKLKQIMDEMSNNDARKSLLLSLKPYLKEDKKDKIDKYIKILSIAKIIEVLGPDILGSDNND